MVFNKISSNKLLQVLALVAVAVVLFIVARYVMYTQETHTKEQKYPLITQVEDEYVKVLYYGDTGNIALSGDICKNIIDFLYNRGLTKDLPPSLPSDYRLSAKNLKDNLELYECTAYWEFGPILYIYLIRNTGDDYGVVKLCSKGTYPGAKPICNSYNIEPKKVAIVQTPLLIGVGIWFEI